jgi:type I restriction enzyme M protein
VQLIDAAQWFKPLRKNLGKKNCELTEEDIKRICDGYLAFEETEQSKIFPNQAFGYWKITVERPLRLHSRLTTQVVESLRFSSGDEDLRTEVYDEFGDALYENFISVEKALAQYLAEWGNGDGEEETEEDSPVKKGVPEKKKKKLLDAKTWERDARLSEIAAALKEEIGDGLFEDHNIFRDAVETALKKLGRKVSASDLKIILRAASWRVEDAPPVISKIHKAGGKSVADPLHGRYASTIDGKKHVVEYEPDTDLRDTEQIPLLEEGGIETFFKREVLPYTADAWIDDTKTKVGYEISFTRHFYKPQPMRTMEEIRADILNVEKEAEGLLDEILGQKVEQ